MADQEHVKASVSRAVSLLTSRTGVLGDSGEPSATGLAAAATPDAVEENSRHNRASELIASSLRSAGWLLAAQAVAGLTVFALSTILARQFGPEEYGRWALAWALVSFFAVLANFGLPIILVRDLARRKEGVKPYLGAALLLSGTLGVLIFGLIALVQPLISSDATVRWLSYLLGLQMLLITSSLVGLSYLRAFHRTYMETLARVVQALLVVGLALFLVRLRADLVAFGWAAVLGALVGFLLPLCYVVRRVGWLVPRVDLRLWRRLLLDTWPIGVGMLLTSIYYYMDSLMMGALGQRVQLGWYGAAYLVVMAAPLAVTALRNGFLPAQSRAFAGEGDLQGLLRDYGALSAAVGVPIAVLGPLMAGPLLSLLFGPEYLPATFAFRCLLVTAGVMFLSSCYGSNLLASGRQSLYLAGVGLGTLVNLVLNIALIPRFSLDGAAVATLSAEAAVIGYMWFQSRRFEAPSPLAVAYLPLLACALPALLLVGLGGWLPFIPVAVAAGTLYGLLALRLRAAGSLGSGLKLSGLRDWTKPRSRPVAVELPRGR